jgi:hypothetical protein
MCVTDFIHDCPQRSWPASRSPAGEPISPEFLRLVDFLVRPGALFFYKTQKLAQPETARSAFTRCTGHDWALSIGVSR